MNAQAVPHKVAGSSQPQRTAPCEQAPDAPIDSQQLLQGRREVAIMHLGTRYRLQATRTGKLILIK